MDGEHVLGSYGILRHGAYVEDVGAGGEVGVFGVGRGCHRSPLMVDALHIILVELCLHIIVGEGREVDGERVLVMAEYHLVGALQLTTEHDSVESLVDRDAVDEQIGDEHVWGGNTAMELFASGVDGDHAVARAEDDAAVGQTQRTVLGEGVAQHVVGEQIASDVVVVRVHA